MSTRFLNNNSDNNTDVVAKTFSGTPPVPTPWVRNPSWPACEANSGDNRVRGLYAVFPSGGNFIALTVAGAYTVNYGDGTTTNYATGIQANYEYDYNDADLVGTEAPVTFTDSTDTVNRTAHGYINGMQVQFFNITTTTGIVNAQFYFVINATADTFQVSATLGGSAIALTNNGTGQLLPYRVATVTITPQGGSNLTSVNLAVKHNQATLQQYSTGWLDLAFAASTITTVTIGQASEIIRQSYIERVQLNQLGTNTNFSNLFGFLRALQNVVIADTITSSVTNMTNMFGNCYSLQQVPLFNTAAVTNMTNMFNTCSRLQTVPLFNTAAVTTMPSMLEGCSSLQSVPLFNTAAATTMASMFRGCFNLQSVPPFNTAVVTNMSGIFQDCFSLKTIPLFNTAAVTNAISMFYNCSSLQTVPLFNTAAATNMTSMFNGCSSLQSVPLFNTALVTTMANMFNGCSSLKTVPLFNTPLLTSTQSMFALCTSLQTVPLFNTAAVTNAISMFNSCSGLQAVPAFVVTAVSSSVTFNAIFNTCSSLSRIEAKNFRFTFSVASCKLSATALNEIYTNLPTVSGQTITVTGNYGTATDTPSIATAKGWAVTG